MNLTRRKLLGTGAAALSVAMIARPDVARAATTLKMSIDTGPGHHRTVVTERWVEIVNKASGGELTIELYHSAQLFKDSDLPRALRQGAIDIGMPGNWVLGGVDPNNDIFLMPMFFGVPQDKMHLISDGEVGAKLGAKLETNLGVKMVGRWLDHGYSDLHATYPVQGSQDLKGKRVRSFGGAGTEARIRYFGGDPVLIPWADVPLALSQGNFDAMYSVSAGVASSKLWEAGVTHTVVEPQFFHQYLPMIGNAALAKLPEEMQALIFSTWEDNIVAFRASTMAAQAAAHGLLEEKGVTVVRPDPAGYVTISEGLMKTQDKLTTDLKIDPELVALSMKALNPSS
ncbi:TRAP transporter substrate-binding protein DctP [Paracoccus aestuariivivens]|nr:TRAP transporter substrate-binding protein DctP [Paracoccus aestuariivivens]